MSMASTSTGGRKNWETCRWDNLLDSGLALGHPLGLGHWLWIGVRTSPRPQTGAVSCYDASSPPGPAGPAEAAAAAERRTQRVGPRGTAHVQAVTCPLSSMTARAVVGHGCAIPRMVALLSPACIATIPVSGLSRIVAVWARTRTRSGRQICAALHSGSGSGVDGA